MRSKVLIAAGMAMAFVLGTVSTNFLSMTNAFEKPQEAVVSTPSPITAASSPRVVTRTSYVAPRATRVVAPAATRVVKKRSLQKEALIVGGSAGAGAAIGAVAGGGKGAAIGAVTGGVAGLVYDLLTRNKS